MNNRGSYITMVWLTGVVVDADCGEDWLGFESGMMGHSLGNKETSSEWIANHGRLSINEHSL